MVEEFNESLLDYTWRHLKVSIKFRTFEMAVEPRVRDGLLETFKFLATHGLDPGEPARQDLCECQMSRLQQTFECAIVGLDLLTSCLEIIRVIIANSHQNPFEAQSRYQGPLIKVACEMRHELAACIRSQEQWCLQGCFGEDHSFPDYTFPIAPGDNSRITCLDGSFSAFCVNSLVGDPDAIYLKAILHFKVTSYDLPSICLHNLANSRELTENIGGCWDHAVKARVVACLEAGKDWIDEVPLYTVANDGVTLVEFFASNGSLHILEAAWLELGNDLGSFYANFEGEIVCAIVRDLDALRPARKWRQAKSWKQGQEIYDLSSGIFLGEGYRKLFPDDEEEIEKIGYGFDVATFSKRRWGYLEGDFESLPVVNGLTEEFWD
jgi:hypothetical protein